MMLVNLLLFCVFLQKDESADRAGKKAVQKLNEAEKAPKAIKKEKENVAPKIDKQTTLKADKVEKQVVTRVEKSNSVSKPEKAVVVSTSTKVDKPVGKEMVEKPEKAVQKVEKIPVQEAPIIIHASHQTGSAPAPSKSSKKKRNELTLEQMSK